MLNDDLEKNIPKFRINIGDKQLNNPRFITPAELVISRINERIHFQINTIGLLHINNARMQLRIRTINATITAVDDLREKTDEIDINFVRTRKIDYSDTYEKLDRKYKIEKSSQYPTLRRLDQWKKMLSDREKEKIDLEEKYELLENRLDKINNEIDSIQHENKSIANENNFLRNQSVVVKEVPTIMDYAHVIEETKKLQHRIDIWTKRVNIAEVSLFLFII
jgi:chromosome segregation ATPase